MQHRHCLHAGLVPTDSAGRGAAIHLSKYPAEDMEPGPGTGSTVLQGDSLVTAACVLLAEKG